MKKKNNRERKRNRKIMNQNTAPLHEPYVEGSFLEYLDKMFKGMSGWRYISVSKPGSVFKKTGNMIVPIHYHKQLPVLTSDGKYMSEDYKIATCITLFDPAFEGLVITADGYVVEGGNVPEQHADLKKDPSLIDKYNNLKSEDVFKEVDAETMDIASTEYLETLKNDMESVNKKFEDMSKFFADAMAVPVAEAQPEGETCEAVKEVEEDAEPKVEEAEEHVEELTE